MNYLRSCPSPKHLFPETVRRHLKDLVAGVCPRTQSTKRISAMEFRVRTAKKKRRQTLHGSKVSFDFHFNLIRQVMLIIAVLYRIWVSQ